MTANETEKRPARSIAHQRLVKCYPDPKYSILLQGYIARNEMGKSEALNEIIRSFFDKMDPARRQQCLNEGIKVTRSKPLSRHHY